MPSLLVSFFYFINVLYQAWTTKWYCQKWDGITVEKNTSKSLEWKIRFENLISSYSILVRLRAEKGFSALPIQEMTIFWWKYCHHAQNIVFAKERIWLLSKVLLLQRNWMYLSSLRLRTSAKIKIIIRRAAHVLKDSTAPWATLVPNVVFSYILSFAVKFSEPQWDKWLT